MKKARGRKDHYLPQSYLRGFTDPARVKLNKPLWIFDIPHGKWRELSASEIGFARGFYDPFSAGSEFEIADQTFAQLEREFPLIRKQIADSRFVNWPDHLAFLLSYMQMIRARSPLFFEQKQIEKAASPAWIVEEVDHKNNSLKVRPAPLGKAFIQNRTLMEMREEILKGPAQLLEFDWALRWTDNPRDPFITCDHPFVMEGKQPTHPEAFDDPETLLYFPISWQAALFGSRHKFHVRTQRIEASDLNVIRNKYRMNTRLYLVSPIRLSGF